MAKTPWPAHSKADLENIVANADMLCMICENDDDNYCWKCQTYYLRQKAVSDIERLDAADDAVC